MDNSALLGWVLSSNYRKTILMRISKYTMPKDLVESTSIRFSHVSRTLRELREKSLIKIENPSASKGRLYSPTTLGLKIKEMLQEQ